MQLSLSPDIRPLVTPLTYTDNILLIGSCFTEHIAERLQQHKFKVLQNPHGILFNPLSVANSLQGYLDGKLYAAGDLFLLNELWNSWDHHTRFSHIDKDSALAGINQSQAAAASFLQKTDRVIITLGSAFQYYLKDGGKAVSNNHRAPGQWFEKKLLCIPEITDALATTLQNLFDANPFAEVLFTISPVRHIRDGVVDNNRSKARLIEAVHELCSRFEKVHYFPAYELVIDILRDYRYYDIDFVHPNYLATSYVWEQFTQACFSPDTLNTMKQVHDIMIAKAHRPRFPATVAHKNFMQSYLAKSKILAGQHSEIDLSAEIAYFGQL